MKKEQLRFVVLGDTHYCSRKMRGVYSEKKTLPEMPDHYRYAVMAETVLPELFGRIKKLKPDFVISTGDFVEGGMMPDFTKTRREMKDGWSFMKSMGCPLVIAKGTHEEPTAYREMVLPEVAKSLGKKFDKEYFVFERGNCAFLILNYLDYIPGNEQDLWLEKELKRLAESSMKIFIAAHPPLYNWGRHFFNEPPFIKRIMELCRKYPVDGYLCGHTHNQALSFHERAKGKGFLQIMGSSVGYPDMDMRPLDEFHVLAEFEPGDQYIWGLPEDCSPGFYLVETDGDAMKVEWQSFKGDKASASIGKRHARPKIVEKPQYKRSETKMGPIDIFQIKSAVLYTYGIYRNSAEISFNGVSLGQLPCNPVYAARRFVTLGQDALKSISSNNEIKIKLPTHGDFVIGSISLELLLLDNRVIHSEVAPELFIRGDFWKEFPQPRKVIDCKNRKEVSVTVKL